jgi:hypothetical protein
MMVRTCANPKCGAVFKYLHEGKLFAFEGPQPSAAKNDGFSAMTRPTRFFWLCSVCARAMTIAAGSNRGATLVTICKAA